MLTHLNQLQESGKIEGIEPQADFLMRQANLTENPELRGKANGLFAELRFMKRNLTASEQYAREALKYCEIAFDSLHCVSIHSLMGAIYSYQGKNVESLKHYTEAIRICEEAGFTGRAVKIRFNKSVTLAALGRYDQALENNLQCLSFFEEHGEDENRALVYNNLGLLYLNKLSKPAKALSSFRNALAIYQQYDNPFNTARAVSNLALAYTDLEEYDSATFYLQRAVEIRESLNDEGNLAFAYHGLGDIMLKTGKFEKALEHFHTCRQLAVKNGLDEGIYYSGIGLGLCYDSINKPQTAQKYFQEAYEYAAESNDLELLVGSLEQLYHHYRNRGNTAAALQTLEKFTTYKTRKDSIINSEKLNRLEMQYTSELTEKENELLRIRQGEQEEAIAKEKRAKVILYVVTLLMLILLLFLGISYQQRNSILKKLTQQKTVLEEQKRQLDEVNNSKNRLFSVISHDLRGPLGSVISYLDILRHQMDKTDPMAPLIADLQHETRTTLNTLEDLLAWSKIQMSGISLQAKTFDFNKLVREIIDSFSSGARHKKLSLVFDADEETCMVYADEQQMKTVLRNLLSNAVKFSPVNGEVRVRTRSQGESCVLEVADHGKGISEEELKKIKDPQQYYTSAGTQNEKGTGVGLLLAFEYIHMNGGSLDFLPNTPTGTIASIHVKSSRAQMSRIA